MIELIYVSAETRPFSSEELAELLQVARANNTELGVTGVLLYLEGSFLQVLEGPEDVVMELFDKIGLDRRHGSVVLIRRSEIETRNFGEWSMGFREVSASEARMLDGYTGVLRGEPLNVEPDAKRLRTIIDSFQQGRWRQAANQ